MNNGYAPDLAQAEELVPLSETDAVQESLYAQYMGRAAFPDGSRAYITFLNDSMGADTTGGDPTYAERALAAERFFHNIGFGDMVPRHHYNAEQHYLAVEEVDGIELAEEYKPGTWSDEDVTPDAVVDRVGALHVPRAPRDQRAQIGREKYLDFAAATLLSGNSDMKGENVMLADGLIGIDLDHACGDVTAHYETGEPWPESHYERGIRYLETNAALLGLDIDETEITTRAHTLAADVCDGIGAEAALDGIENSRFSDDPVFAYRDNLAGNLSAFTAGVAPGT